MAFICLIRKSMSRVLWLVRGQRSLSALSSHCLPKSKSTQLYSTGTSPCAHVMSWSIVSVSDLTHHQRTWQHRQLCTAPRHRKVCSLLPKLNPYTPVEGGNQMKSQNLVGQIFLEQRRHAGHSKWSNIKHTKAEKDGQRSSLTMKLMRNVKVAIREGGNSDPKANNQLARAIATAFENDIPKTVVENTLKSVVKSAQNCSIIMFDCKGPGSFMMLIETYSSSFNKTRMELHIVFKKFGGQINEKPMGGHFFEHKGIVQAPFGGSLTSFEDAEEAAIMAEAEEVEETVDDDNKPMFQFLCNPRSVHTVYKALLEQNPDVSFNSPILWYIPKEEILVPLSGIGLEAAVRLVEALERIEEVQRVYTNIRPMEE